MTARASSQDPTVLVRRAGPDDVNDIADIWHRGWRDGHVGLVPDELAEVRTEGSFHVRAAQRLEDTTVVTVDGAVTGFVMVVGDEVEQVYVAAAHRGTGVADVLLREAERQVAANGHHRAWLAVVPGNARARAFYERRGWRDEGPFDYPADTERGPVAVPTRRYAKLLG